jgi:hypothetical protein
MATFRGSADNDVLVGSAAADLFLASPGSDILRGGGTLGSAADVLSYAAWGAAVHITLPVPSVDGTTFGSVVKDGPGGGTDSFSGMEQVIGSRFDDSVAGVTAFVLPFGNVTGVLVTSGPGNDTINGASGTYTIADYSDTSGVVADLAAGYARTAEGTDTLVNVRAISGSPGNDMLRAGGGISTLYGGAGDDWLDGAGTGGALFGGAGIDTAVFAAPLSQLSFTYSVHAYSYYMSISSAIDSGYGVGSIDRLMAGGKLYGQGAGVSGVDTINYYFFYPDVARAGLDAEAHYFGTGWREGRDPGTFFSTNTYLGVNPDVRAAGLNPLTHYLQSGWREGRDPSLSFDSEAYLGANPDVRAAGLNPLLHYLGSGREEGRPAIAAIGPDAGSDGFDAQYYRFAYADIRAAGIDPETHYRSLGQAEGRSPSAYFNTTGYLAAYADVRAAGVDPLTHYLTVGWHEGRDPSGAFDTLAYLAANPDVAAAGVDPLLHFLGPGHAEGRLPLGDYVFHQG